MDKSIRNYSLDIARILAIFAVILTHCSAKFVVDFDKTSFEFACGNLFDSISRIGVPMFLMISGSLFLNENREFTIKNILTKYIVNIVVTTVIWAVIYSLVYNIALPLMAGDAIDSGNIVKDILNGHHHMWYLYVIIGIYMIIPFLKKFVSPENKSLVLFFIVISSLAQFFTPVITMLCGAEKGYFAKTWLDNFHLDFFCGYVTYFLAGWYIVHVKIEKKWAKNTIYILGAISLLAIILTVYFTGDYNNGYNNLNIFVFLYSISVFLALNNIKFKVKEKLVNLLSKLTFGCYITHIMVLTAFNWIIPYNGNCILYLLSSFIVVAVVSFSTSWILSKIPLVKKLVKM